LAKTVEDRNDMILEFIKRRYDGEMEKITSSDSKASNLIGFVSVVIGLVVGGGAFKISVIAAQIYLWPFYFGGVVLLLLSIFFGLRSFIIRNWKVAPEVQALLDILMDTTTPYTEQQYGIILKASAKAMVEATTHTELKNKAKADYIYSSWRFLIIGLVLMGIFLAIFAFSGAAVQNDKL
jgi:hypothetical protein